MLLPAATLRRYLQQAEPSISWNPTPRVNDGRTPRARGADGLRRIRSLNTLPMPQTSAVVVGRGRERGGAGV